MDAPDWVVVAVVVAIISAASLFAVVTLAPGGVDVPGVGSIGGVEDDDGLFSTSPAAEQGNETGVHHEDPTVVEGQGDVREALVRRMAQRLQRSNVEVSREQYERAKAAVGDEFQGTLEKYAAAATETGTDDDDRRAAALKRIHRLQRRYGNLTAGYDRTLEQYRNARRLRDTDRARSKARTLLRVADRIRTVSTDLNRTYATLGNLTGTEYAGTTARIDETRTSVTETVRDVRESMFVPTTLDAEVANESASVTDPVTIVGRLSVAVDAAPPSYAWIEIGNRTTLVAVDENGSFRTGYRPTSLSAGAQTVTVAYRPANASVYLPANDTVSVRVTPATPSVDVKRVPREVGVGEPVDVAGSVSVAGTGVSNVSVRVLVDNETVTTARTTTGGRFDVAPAFPAWVGAGNHTLAIVVGRNRSAIAPRRVTTPLRVRATDPRLSMDVERHANATVTVRGRLATDAGRPLPNRTVVVSFANKTVGTARTNAQGAFVRRVAIPTDADGGRAIVGASFDGVGTSLSGATATRQISLPRQDASGSGPPLAVLGGAGLLVVGGLVVVFYLRSGVPGVTEAEASDRAGGPGGAGRGRGSVSIDGSSQAAALDPDALDVEATPGLATIRAYAALRAAIGPAVGVPEGATHWEFHEAVIQDLDSVGRDLDVERQDLDGGPLDGDDLADRLREVTIAYELAAFAPTAIDGDRAAAAVENVRAIVDTLDGEAE